MIDDIPRGGRFPTLISWRKSKGLIPDGEGEPDEERTERWEMRQWGSIERELAAGQLNILNSLLHYVPQWKKEPPKPAVVGPREWWPEEQRKEHDKKLRKTTQRSDAKSPSVEEVMASFGWAGG